MISIKFILVLLAFTLIEINCVNPLVLNKENEGDIIDIAKAALKALEKIVDGISSFSLVTLDTLESVIKTLETLVLKFAKVEIDQIGNQIFAKLDELKKGANIIAVDIIDCTEDREEDLKQLLVTFLNDTGKCAVDRVNEVLDSLAVVVKDIKSINEEVKNITAELEDCEKASNTTACVIKVIEDIEKAATDIPPEVTEDINKAKKKVNELENYLFECEHDTINQLEITSQEIYNGIVECVEGKLIHPSVTYLS